MTSETQGADGAGTGAETDALVDRFAVALKEKLYAAEAKYGWKNGWLKSDWRVECQHGLLRHVGKGDPLDVAAYAAFCWHHGWPTASQHSTEFVTGAVRATAEAIAAYAARYPDGSLLETSDDAIVRWNRVAAAVIASAQAATPGVPDSLRALSEAFAETACCASCTTPMDCYQGKPCRLEPVGSGSGVVDHEFKSHPDVFWPAARGEKTFEYRRDDRGGYEVGQTVRLRCYDLTRGYHDTAPLDRRVTNILRGGEFELPMGYCILSLAPLAAQPAGQSEQPILRATVDVFANCTDTRLSFGDRTQPEPGVKAVQQAIAALTAEYEARGGCPVVGRHPAGQSTDDGTDRCEVCNKPLIAGQRVMQDVELGTVHAACCGPEREAYVKDVETGEPLGPNDPIPHGYVYEGEDPAGQSTGLGADAAAWKERLERAFYDAGGFYGQMVEYAARTALPVVLAAIKPAPNSTRTGAAETEEVAEAVASEREVLRKAVSNALHDNQFLDGWPEMVDPVVEAVLAARPEAPSDAGWRSQAADEIDAIADLWSGNGRSYAKTIAAILRAEEPEQLPPADAETKRQVQRAWDRFKVGTSTPPSDPAPSGQAEG